MSRHTQRVILEGVQKGAAFRKAVFTGRSRTKVRETLGSGVRICEATSTASTMRPGFASAAIGAPAGVLEALTKLFQVIFQLR